MQTFLLTNDDGMDAPGIHALKNALQSFGRVVMVAPADVQSGISHKVSIWSEIDVIPEGPDRYRVYGTPADCTRIGLTQLVPEADMVFSGINIGANLGYDIYLSGTVAAARESAFHGVPAIAISQYLSPDTNTSWQTACDRLIAALPRLMDEKLSPGEFLNVNLPKTSAETPKIRFATPERTPYDTCVAIGKNRFAYQADIHSRPRPAGSDVDVCFSGDIAVSRLSI